MEWNNSIFSWKGKIKFGEEITIDIDQLRNDLREDCLGAYFGGGFGAAFIESFDVDRATTEQLVEMAQRQGINLCIYRWKDG